jgi:hypothetical protein
MDTTNQNGMNDGHPQYRGGQGDQGPPPWLQQMLQSQQTSLLQLQQQSMNAFMAQQERILADQRAATAREIEAIRTELCAQQDEGLRVPTPTTTRPGSVQPPEDTRGGHPQTDLAGENSRRPPRSRLEYDDSNRTLYPAFKLQLESELEDHAFQLGSEAKQVMYGFACLRKKALERIYPWVEVHRGTALFTVNNFLTQMDQAFGDPERRSRALAELADLRQDKQNFADFITMFESKMLEAGAYLDLEETKKERLRSAINSRLFRAMIGRDAASTYDEYRRQLYSVAHQLEEADRRFSNRSLVPRIPTGPPRPAPYIPPRAPAPAPANAPARLPHPDAMEVDTPVTSNRRARWVTEAELAQRREKRQCFRCGDAKHRIQNCPYKPAICPQPQANRAQTEAGPDLEPEDAVSEPAENE